jgi:hypothetical protein
MSPWPLIFVLLALIAIGGAVAYFSVHGAPNWATSSGGTTGGGGTAPPHLNAITAYDPVSTGGDGHEHNADAPKATDSSATSYWETEDYHSSFAALGKQGVGLVLDAGRPVQLHQLGLVTQTPGFTAVIRAGDSATGPFADVSASQLATGQTTFVVHGGKHRYYLIWITQLPPANGSVRINDVKAT